MSIELYIHLHPDVSGSIEEILAGFPFEEGQNIVTYSGGVIVVSLGDADDTNTVQDWYLNSNEDVQSYYIVED